MAGRAILHALNLFNARLNHATVAALHLTADDHVLDVGFGGGVGVRYALLTLARVSAVDPSPAAVRSGRARLPAAVRIHLGDAATPGVPDASCDAVYSVNTIYFWPDVGLALAGLHRALRPGGRISLGVEERELGRHARVRAGLPATTDELREIVARSGFHSVSLIHRRAGRTVLRATRS